GGRGTRLVALTAAGQRERQHDADGRLTCHSAGHRCRSGKGWKEKKDSGTSSLGLAAPRRRLPDIEGEVASGASLRWEPRYVEGGAPPIRCARSRPPPESSLWSEQDAVNDAVLLPDRRQHSGLRGSAPAGFPHRAPATAGAAQPPSVSCSSCGWGTGRGRQSAPCGS